QVGIIDVSPLGKIDLRGPDVPKLLNLLYTNKWSKLDIGKVRYGAMMSEDGVVMDDGVTAHLGEDHYLLTTTSGGAGRVWDWIEEWLQAYRPEWQVHATPVTTAYTSINIAGPHSRTLLSRLTDVDLSADAFKFMQVRTGTVAGVAQSILWRIGFTGELSYEIRASRLRSARLGSSIGSRQGSRCWSIRYRSPARAAFRKRAPYRRSGHRRPHSGLQRRVGLGDQTR